MPATARIAKSGPPWRNAEFFIANNNGRDHDLLSIEASSGFKEDESAAIKGVW
jgi:hypothetical protein